MADEDDVSTRVDLDELPVVAVGVERATGFIDPPQVLVLARWIGSRIESGGLIDELDRNDLIVSAATLIEVQPAEPGEIDRSGVEPDKHLLEPIGPDTGRMVPVDDEQVIVLASGNLGLVSFSDLPGRATRQQIEAAHPGLVDGLHRHDGVGLVLVRDDVDDVTRVVETDIDINHVNDLGWIALMETVLLGDGSEPHQQIVTVLLDAGADASITDREGITPSQHA